MKRLPYFSRSCGSWVIPLTQGVLCLVDEQDVAALAANQWCAARMGGRWTAMRTERRKGVRQTIYMHRWLISPENDKYVDHVIHRPLSDRILDNRRSNIRECTPQENSRNKKRQRTAASRYKGVFPKKTGKPWLAAVRVKECLYQIGKFHSDHDAAYAYNYAAAYLFGEFALLNKVYGVYAHD